MVAHQSQGASGAASRNGDADEGRDELEPLVRYGQLLCSAALYQVFRRKRLIFVRAPCRCTSMQMFYDLERSSHNLLVIEDEHGALAVLSAFAKPCISLIMVSITEKGVLCAGFHGPPPREGATVLQAVFNVVSPVSSMSAVSHQDEYKHGETVLAGPAGEHLHWCVVPRLTVCITF